MNSLTLRAVADMPIVRQGDDVAVLIAQQLRAHDEQLQPGDIVVIAQKIVSKAEGRLVRLSSVSPGEQALELAEQVGKDPAVVQVILDDSRSTIRSRPGLLITEQAAGWICANAGVDHSNVAPDDEGQVVLALLPADADRSAQQIRRRLGELTGVEPAVIINDSHGRPWRIGTVGVCIGCAGMPPVWDQRGLHDLHGYELVSSEECIADELAAAASLLMGQGNEGLPVVIVRGYQLPADAAPRGLPAPARAIQRPADADAFR